MSLLDEVTTQQVVYGPDGKAYGNPAIARNAGVNQYYREDGTPYPVATPAASGMGSGDPYSQIMGQSGGVSPYQRIMAQMTPTMNPYTGAGVAIGGYDPALYNRRSGSGLINYGGGGGMGGGGGGGGGDYTPTPSDWDNMSNSQKAAYYAENPNMASVTRGLQTLFGNTLYGKAQNYFNPGFVSEQRLLTSVDPVAYQKAKESFRASEIFDMNAAAEAAQVEAGRQAAQESFRSSEITQQNQDSTPSGGSYDAGSYGGYSGSETQSSGESYANFNGGLVSNVFGPNPAGPDDGAGMLQLGEYVIKKSAVKKYGQGLLDMINNGKIPAKKLKSLLG
jgi:hypothetical protein